ncbi:hypothetical protein DL96DRAFT_1712246 [Flagelloscypha sp. PMI_526]|nr:hypothetical protein DL96DRAFT_1712246 [Flagelloscypha sp. PMI_526]
MDPIWMATPLVSGQRRRANSMSSSTLRSLIPRSSSTHDLTKVTEPSLLRKSPPGSNKDNNPPRRPPRNPARVPRKRSATARPSTSTGIPEQSVSPWDSFRRPSIEFVGVRTRAESTNTGTSSPIHSPPRSPPLSHRQDIVPWEYMSAPDGIQAIEHIPGPLIELPGNPQRQEITPWEFAPPPEPEPELEPESSPSPIATHNPNRTSRFASAVRQSSVSSGFGDKNPLVRRRKSIDNRQHPPRSAFYHFAIDCPKLVLLNASSPAGTFRPGLFPLTTIPTPRSLKGISMPGTTKFDLKGHDTRKKPKKHHRYDVREVPYPRDYERDVLDLDVWENLFCQQLCGSLTFHKFETPPSKVLDLGCGTGIWVMNCARVWKNSQFVGLDLVPLHPDLRKVGSSELADRITWVQGNFLEGLPFPNEEFDFVHIKRIAMGVPEDKWDALMEEITRVMKPGAAFEMIEEDLFFPGKSAEESDDEGGIVSSSDDDISELDEGDKNGSGPIVRSRVIPVYTGPSVPTDDGSASSTNVITFPPTPRSTSPQTGTVESDKEGEATLTRKEAGAAAQAANPPLPPSTPAKVVSTAAPVLSSRAMFTQSVSPPNTSSPPSALRNSTKFAASTSSLVNTPLKAFSDSGHDMHGPGRQRGHSSTSTLQIPPTDHSDSQGGAQTLAKPKTISLASASSHNIRTPAKAPSNPRDHSLLEIVYNEMHARRFVNLSPLSLLANSLGLYFKGLKTHPPLQLTFPPPPRAMRKTSTLMTMPEMQFSHRQRRQLHRTYQRDDGTSRLLSITSATSGSSDISEADRVITEKGLMYHASSYAALDTSRTVALSPTAKTFSLPPSSNGNGSLRPEAFPPMSASRSSFIARISQQQEAIGKRLRDLLPHGTINLDLRTLNLHLKVRTAEILGCGESMWEWVVWYQRETRSRKRTSTIGSSQQRMDDGGGPWHRLEEYHQEVVDMTREDFDKLLTRFELDMEDQMMLSPVIEDRFDWDVFYSELSPERLEFQAGCKLWDQWELEQQLPLHPTVSSGKRQHRPNRSISDSSHSAIPLPSVASEDPALRRSASRKSHLSSTGRRNGRSRSRSISMHSGSGVRPPSARLSRSLRVFVAWKPT